MKNFLNSVWFGITVIGVSTVIYAALVLCFGEADFGIILASAFGTALFNRIEEVKEKIKL